MNSHSEMQEPTTAAELIARYRDVRSPTAKHEPIPPHARRSPRSPSPPASPNHGRLKPRFNIKLRLAKPFKQFRHEPACQSPTSSAETDGRRSPRLVTRRFGASAWRPAGHCRAWEDSSNAITRPSCTRSARWRSSARDPELLACMTALSLPQIASAPTPQPPPISCSRHRP